MCDFMLCRNDSALWSVSTLNFVLPRKVPISLVHRRSLGALSSLLNLPPGLADGTYQGELLTLIVPPQPFHSLTPFQCQLHYHISQKQVVVENFIFRLKVFECLTLRWRHALPLHQRAFKVVTHCVPVDVVYRPIRQT